MRGEAGRGTARSTSLGRTRIAMPGLALHCDAGRGTARQGWARHGRAGQGAARRGEAMLGTARRGKVYFLEN